MAQRGPARRLGVGPTSTSFSSWKLGLPSRTLPKRMEVPSPAGCTILREEPGHPGPPTPDLGLCCSQSYSKRTFPHHRRGLGQRRGRPSPSVVVGVGAAQLFLGLSYEKSPLATPSCVAIGSQAQSRRMSTPQAQHLACGARGRPLHAGELCAIYNPLEKQGKYCIPSPRPCDLQPMFELSMGKQVAIRR